MISQIAAMSKNRVIGVKNDLPWNIPEDMKFFKDTTRGHICIMGRKTFESMGAKPLPKRLNVIVTRQKDYAPEGTVVFSSVEEALEFAKQEIKKKSEWGNEIFICGGGEIYAQTLPLADRVYLTVIDKEYEGDAFFPELKISEFKLVQESPRTEPVPFSFRTYQRIK